MQSPQHRGGPSQERAWWESTQHEAMALGSDVGGSAMIWGVMGVVLESRAQGLCPVLLPHWAPSCSVFSGWETPRRKTSVGRSG